MIAIVLVVIVAVVLILVAVKNSSQAPAYTIEESTTEESSVAAAAPVYARYMELKIAGINFRKGIADYVGKSRGQLIPEPTNKHDQNAIAIYCDGKHVGYVPADDTADVRALGMAFPIDVYCEIFEDYEEDDEGRERKFYWGTALIELPD